MFVRSISVALIVAFAALVPARGEVARALNVVDLREYEGRTIASVEIDFEEAAPEESLLSELRGRIRLAEGGRFSIVQARESLLELFKTGRVANARVEASNAPPPAGEDGRPRVALRFVVRPHAVVERIEFEVGVTEGTEITEDELRARLSLLEPGRAATTQALRASADAIQVYMRDRGFYRARVEDELQFNPSRTRVVVTFKVEPGEPTLVQAFNVNIVGFDASRVASELSLRPGARFTLESLGKDLSRIRRAVIETNHLAPRIEEPNLTLLSDVNRMLVEVEGAVGPVVEVDVQGMELSESKRRELLPILREGTIDLAAIIEGARRLRNRLQEDGYFFAEVGAVCTVVPPLAAPPSAPQTGAPFNDQTADEFITCLDLDPEELSDRKVAISYVANRGRRYKLTDIRITGTDQLSEVDKEELKDGLRTREANVLGIVPFIGYGRGYTSEDALEQDRRTIEAKMRDLGYRRAAVTILQGVSVEGESLIITFDVEEGPLTRVAGIEMRGNQIFTAQELRDERCPRDPFPDEVCLIDGGAYSRSIARTDGERIRAFYARNGYVDSSVDVDVVELPAAANGDERVRVVYTISEAEKVFINRIYVNGAVTTKKQAILDAIPLREGEALESDELLESERILINQTGDAFRQVIIRTESAGKNASGYPLRDVFIDVEERKRIVMDYGGGFSTDNGPLGLFELRNSNLFGELKQGAIRLRASRRQQLLRLEYFDPRFRRYGVKDFSPLTFSVQYTRDTSVTRFFRSTIDRGTRGVVQRFDEEGSLINEFGENVSEPSINRFQVNLETQRDLELEIGRRGEIRKRSTIFLRYNYEDVRLYNIGSLLLAPVLRADQAVRLSRFGAAFARDTRDRQFDPTRGDLFRIDYGLALKALGGNLSFSKLLTDYSRYYKMNRVRETVFAARVQLGLARIYDPPDRNRDGAIDEADRRMPISERFFSGGSTTLRGFGFEEAGPRVVAPFCAYGSAPDPLRPNLPPCGTFRNEKGEPIALNPFTVPIGGNALAVVNLEARVGLTRNVQAVPFYDGGNVFRRAGDIFKKRCETDSANPLAQNQCASWTHTVGFGVRIKTPLGPLAVDYGYLLNPPEFVIPQATGAPAVHQLRRSHIHFRFGQSF